MPSVKVYNTSGAAVGTLDLNEDIFGREYNEALVHQAVVTKLSNDRQGTKSTLTRAEVRGGGIKPWRQKGTGRARQGSIRSPQWTGGGVVFAPKPRDFGKKMNVKAKREAIKSALSYKVANEQFIVLDDLVLTEAKTREMVQILNNLKLDKKILVVIPSADTATRRASGNIEGVTTIDPAYINAYDLVVNTKILLTKDSVSKITEVLQ